MKITTKRHVTHTLTLDDDTELEILFDPIPDSTVVQRTGDDKIKVGYLVQDDGHGSDPMEEGRCNGELVLLENRNGAEHRIKYALGLDDNGYPDIDREFQIGSDTVTLRSLAAHDSNDEPEELYPRYFEFIARWVVPVDYHDFGSSGTRVRLHNWKGNFREGYPVAIWIADEDARANLEFKGKVPTRAEIEDYCKGVLEEYEMWCNGEVYGVVVETFTLQSGWGDPWKKTDGRDNECWGHVGFDYAKEALKEEMQ